MIKFTQKTRSIQQSKPLSFTEALSLIAVQTNHEPKLYGNGYQMLCPSHKDNRPSLSIKEGDDGRILLYCFGGCSVQEICSALGIQLKDLFPNKSKGY
jgi:hypothetical protein